MIHINTETNPVMLAASGDQLEIASDICLAVGRLYLAMCRQDPHAREIFRKAVIAGIADPDTPTWKLRQRPGEITIAMCKPKGGA